MTFEFISNLTLQLILWDSSAQIIVIQDNAWTNSTFLHIFYHEYVFVSRNLVFQRFVDSDKSMSATHLNLSATLLHLILTKNRFLSRKKKKLKSFLKPSTRKKKQKAHKLLQACNN